MMTDRSPEDGRRNRLWVSFCVYSRRPTQAHCLVTDRVLRLSRRRAMKAFSFPSTEAADFCIGQDLLLYLDITAFEFKPEVRVANGPAADEEDGGNALHEMWRLDLDGANLANNEAG